MDTDVDEKVAGECREAQDEVDSRPDVSIEDEKCEMKHPAGASEDSADAPDDDTHHHDAAREPPNAAKRVREGEGQKLVEEVEEVESRESRVCAEGTGGDDDDGRGPGESHEPHDDLPHTARAPEDVHVDPDGRTAVEPNRCAAS
ncbi:hypothetical protein OG21DRAFT_1488432 [Imleria badia]|nr:hypothetical protein OG21DRAFT_1488432 [Imleria badia]